jgi:hypothetical protein
MREDGVKVEDSLLGVFDSWLGEGTLERDMITAAVMNNIGGGRRFFSSR